MATAKTARETPAPEPTVDADPFAALLDAVEFEPKANAKRDTVEVPQKYRDLVLKAYKEGQRVRIPVTDMETFNSLGHLLRSAGDLEKVSVQCKARFENDKPIGKDDDGKAIYADDLGEMTHLQFTVGNRRGNKSAKSE